ncbi:MAG: BatD family protein [Chitinophagales bacterium]|nr:protein BatD [Bacteroidota bacterium]
MHQTNQHKKKQAIFPTHWKKVWLIFLFVFISTSTLFSQQFTASTEYNQIPINYSFDITYTIEGGKAQNFTPPNFDGFQAYGPAQGTNISIINGRISKSTTISYTLQAKKQGTFTIPPATAIINGKEMKTNSVTVTITAPQERRRSNSNDPFQDMMDQMEEMQRQMMQQFQQPTYTEEEIRNYLKKNLFVLAVPSKTNIYEGEQTTLSYKIYARVTCNGISADKMPSFKGFLNEEFKLPEQQEPKVETYDGVQYQTLEVKRVTLFPLDKGAIAIEPMELTANVYLSYQPYEYKFKSSAVTINVLPLPEKNKPTAFSGAVGKFSFSADYDKTKVKVGEPITLKITYNGTGNLKLITAPKLEFPEEFEAYEPKTTDNYANNGNVVSGSKTFEYVIVPQDGGTFKMPKYEFAYFDVDKKDYVKFTLPETTIEVSGKAKLSENVINFLKREKEKQPRGIYGIKTQYNKSKDFVGSSIFWTLTTLPFLFLLLGFIFRKRDYSETQLLLMRRKKANKIALRRMAIAKKLLAQNKEKEFYNEVIRALWHYLSDKLEIPQSELSKENIAEKLQTRQVHENKINDLHTTLDTCEQALFSPIGQQIAMQQTYNKAIELIIDLEEELKTIKNA